jgi:hypothetical protein
MAGTLRLSNTGTGNGQSTITTAASGDTTYALPSGGGTFVTTSSTQALTVPFASGTASAPSVTFLGDSNTGIYSPGADQVAVATNGTGRLFVDASGNVGVGTSSVNALLEVNNSTAGGEVQRIEGNYSGSGSVILTNWRRAGGSVAAAFKYNDDTSPLCMSIGTTTSHEFRIRTADTDAITIDASQRVGIGTSSPSNLLHVSGTSSTPAVFERTSATGSFIALKDSTSQTFIGNTNGVFSIQTPGSSYSDKLVVTSTGNVGIGTTSAQARLHVKSGVTNYTGGLFLEASANDSGTFLWHDGTKTVLESSYISSGSYTPIAFHTSNSERARIDTSGRLLVGTSTARGNFFNHIISSAFNVEVSTDSTVEFAGIRNRNDTNGGAILLAKSRGTTAGSNTIIQSGDELGRVSFQGSDGSEFVEGALIQAQVDGTPGSNDMPGRLVFSTTADGASSPTERMRIGSGGHLYATCSDTSLASLTLRKGAAGADGIDYLQCRDSGNTAKLVIASTGNVQNTNGSYTSFSDAKLKENIIDANSQWSDIKAVKIRNWNFKTETGYQTHRQIGPIAQELETICPNLVFDVPDRNESGEDIGTVTKGVNQSVLYMKAVKALQEAMERIETLEGMVAVNNITIDEQQHQLSTLAARLTALESA